MEKTTPDLAARRHWVFDMDGTLTVAVHDFPAIRRELGLPEGRPILEALDAMPPELSRPLYERLDAIEFEVAGLARAQSGAHTLLDALVERGVRLGIVTRNGETIAHETLRCCGLAGYFDPACVIGRESAPPKPEPDGINLLLERWAASATDAVMIGDFHFDLDAGARAGTATVYYDPDHDRHWIDRADIHVRGHEELLALVEGGPLPPASSPPDSADINH